MDRRQCLLRGAALGAAGCLGTAAVHAGGQVEEPLADSVRTALASAIANSAPPVPEFTDTEKRLAYLRWLGVMSDRLRHKKPDFQTRIEFLQTVWYETRRAGIGHHHGDGSDPGRKCVPQVRDFAGRRPRLHADHAVLVAPDR